MKKLLSILAVILLGAGPLYAAKVTDVTLSYQPGETIAKINVTGQVRLTHLTEVPKNGRGHRVIVDILAATHELGQKNFTSLPKCMVSSIRTSQFAVVPEQIVRFVFDVNQAPLYRIESDKSSVTIYFTDKSGTKFANWTSKGLADKQKVTAPKLAKPKTPAPKVVASKLVEPKVATPKVVASKTIEPKLATPKVVASKPKVATPKVVASKPKVTTPKVVASKLVEPKVATPKVVASKSVEPKLATPKVVASKPKATTPKVVASKPIEPKLATPKAAKPKTVASKAAISKPPVAGVADQTADNELDMFAMGKRPNPTKWTSSPQPNAKQTTTVAKPVQPVVKAELAKAPAVVKQSKAVTTKPATKPATLATTTVAKPAVVKPVVEKPKSVKPKSSQRKPVVVAKTKSATSSSPKTMPLKSEMKPSGDKKVKPEAKKSGQSALANKIAKPKATTKVASAPKAKKEQPAKSITSRFRRTSNQLKVKGTMVVEFPKRLVIKYKGKRYRDPFETLINASRTNNNPIEKRVPNIDGLRLVGVIESDSKSDRALFEDTDGFGFILKSGDKVRNGYVLRVESDRVYFQIFEYGWSRTVALQLDN